MSILNRLPTALIKRLKTNHSANAVAREVEQMEIDHFPVVKLFLPGIRAVWLLSEFDCDAGMFFGLCDLGSPELGYVALSDLDSVPTEYDPEFVGSKPVTAYAADARHLGHVAV